jgi:DNA polymerase III delta prime subunit
VPLSLSGPELEIGLRTLDVPVVVRCHGGHAGLLRESVAHTWRDCTDDAAVDDPDRAVVDVVLDDDETVVEQARLRGATASTSLEHLLHDLSPVVTERAITRNAGRLLMLHAAGVADSDSGACVALVAPSGTGKTTATRILARELGYASDETVGIREDLGVVAHPKPLSILTSEQSALKVQTPASRLGLQPTPTGLHLAGVLVLRRDPDGPEVEVAPVRTVLALAELAPQTSYLSRLPRPLHRLADALVATGGLRLVTYREADALRPVVRDLLDGAA